MPKKVPKDESIDFPGTWRRVRQPERGSPDRETSDDEGPSEEEMREVEASIREIKGRLGKVDTVPDSLAKHTRGPEIDWTPVDTDGKGFGDDDLELFAILDGIARKLVQLEHEVRNLKSLADGSAKKETWQCTGKEQIFFTFSSDVYGGPFKLPRKVVRDMRAGRALDGYTGAVEDQPDLVNLYWHDQVFCVPNSLLRWISKDVKLLESQD